MFPAFEQLGQVTSLFNLGSRDRSRPSLFDVTCERQCTRPRALHHVKPWQTYVTHT
jgi:hypothetical protein